MPSGQNDRAQGRPSTPTGPAPDTAPKKKGAPEI